MENLTPREKALVLAAVYATSPCGGGSESFSVYRKLAAAWDMTVDDTLLNQACEVVLEGARECGVI